ncbi:O-antigen ligase family protein [Blastococcus sp. CT_GayMR16]|uniref:O-antigen ligase family protein n=1 Tax=Blastococcus sp. CT_GayMR16 TaxID=2559607 RepID=UPI0010745A61|nr:O-antigen ligase family protein [Blastococcus sp. CT_GayMR16]TFV90713.1 O-antigen ligase domain-containing protein [Blastococcus sp. CT_GayMR16]
MSRVSARLLIVGLCLVGSTVVWRQGTYFSGSVDPVVAAKGLLSLIGLAVAVGLAQSAPRRPVGTGTLWFVGVFLLSSVFGAVTGGTLAASGPIVVRVAILTATVYFLLRAAPAADVIRALVRACAVVAVVATVTGVPTLAEGRLGGGIPPLNPNELALLSGIVVLAAAWRILRGHATWPGSLTVLGFLVIIWLTGSRTSLIMVLLGLAVMTMYVRRPRVGLVVTLLCTAAVAVLVVATTGVVDTFVERGGDGTSTLDSRLIAWRAAWGWAESAWQIAFGGGLSVKFIPVAGQWWNTQLLDSSWVSALVQAGWVGLLVALAWVLWIFRGLRLAPREERMLFTGLAVFLVGRSLLESGLFDATPGFLLLVAISLQVEGGTRLRASGRRLRSAVAAPPERQPVPYGTDPATSDLSARTE